MKGLGVLLPLLAACLLGAGAWCDPHAQLTIDASPANATPLSLALGHNVNYYRDAGGLWDPNLMTVDSSGLAAVRFAGTRGEGFMRFPGGDPSEEYHWRRGVGDPANRPDDYGYTPNRHFGTDEFMQLVNAANDTSSAQTAVPLITVNWWGWNNRENTVCPPTPNCYWYDASGVKGEQEAANWVEYCNGAVDDTLISTAISGGWQPSWFEASPPYSATSWRAEETADDEYSWCSWEGTGDGVPSGYFAWLRYHFAKERGVTDEDQARAPYNVKYWEIGNETYKFWYDIDQQSWQITWPAFCTYYKSGVIAYSTAMKAVDPTIKIGALLDNNANTKLCSYDTAGNPSGWASTDTPGPTWNSNTETWDHTNTWDTTVIDGTVTCVVHTSPTLYAADFYPLHMGVGALPTGRYSGPISGSVSDTANGETDPPVQISAGDIIRVRAKGVTSAGPPLYYYSYPRMQVILIGEDSAQHKCIAPHDPRACDEDDYNSSHCDEDEVGLSVWVCYDKTAPHPYCTTWAPAGSEARTDYGTSSYPGRNQRDYVFTAPSGLDTASYRLYVRLLNNSDGKQINMNFATHQSSGTEYPFQMGDPDDQTKAYFAAPVVAGRRVAGVKAYVQAQREDATVGCTEFTYAVSPFDGQTQSLKSAINIAGLMLEMAVNGADFGTFLCIQDGSLYSIAQKNGNWDPYQFKFTDLQPSPAFIASPVANVYHLYTNYMGDRLLAVSNDETSPPTFTSPDGYDGLHSVSDVPYLNALATAQDTAGCTGTHHKTIYLLAINKSGNPYPCDVTVENLGFVPTSSSATWRVLRSHNDPASLDDENDQNRTTRIAIDPPASAWASIDPNAGNVSVSYPAGGLPGYSAAVLRLDVAHDNASTHGISAAHEVANDTTADVLGAVTAVSGNTFYMEDTGRSSGILVDLGQQCSLTRGDLVSVTGAVQTTSDGERYISASPTSVAVFPGPAQELKPLDMPNKSFGGESPSQYTPGVPLGTYSPDVPYGVYTVGLLAATAGTVTEIDIGSPPSWYYIDDGSTLVDDSHTGLRVEGFVPQDMAVGDYLSVTGISSVRLADTVYRPRLLPRDSADVIVQSTGQNRAQMGSRALPAQEAPAEMSPPEGTVDYALAQADTSSVSLNAAQVVNLVEGYFGVKEPYEIVTDQPRLLVTRTCQVGLSCLVDVQGTITTNEFGRRIITGASVWLYTDGAGRVLPPNPQIVNTLGANWPFKLRIQ